MAGPAVAEEDGSSNMDSYWSGAPEFPGSEVSEEWVSVDDGVRLRVITWRPTESINRPVVVFVAGWGSVFEGWFLNSQKNGKGRLIHSDGDVY